MYVLYLQTPVSIFFFFLFWCNDVDLFASLGVGTAVSCVLGPGRNVSPIETGPRSVTSPRPLGLSGDFLAHSPSPSSGRLCSYVSEGEGHWAEWFSWAWRPGSTMVRCTSTSRTNSPSVCPGGKMGEGPSLYLSFFFKKKNIIWNV